MKTKTIDCFLFSELSSEQKAKVIEKYNDINTDHDWSQWTIDDWKEKLERQGFLSPEIYFSGFWSQGDGASFTAEIDLEKFLSGRRIKAKYAPELALYQETGETMVGETKFFTTFYYPRGHNAIKLSAANPICVANRVQWWAKSFAMCITSNFFLLLAVFATPYLLVYNSSIIYKSYSGLMIAVEEAYPPAYFIPFVGLLYEI